jgi:hypothetical protein
MSQKVAYEFWARTHRYAGSNMTGTDLCVNKPHSVPVIFEPSYVLSHLQPSYSNIYSTLLMHTPVMYVALCCCILYKFFAAVPFGSKSCVPGFVRSAPRTTRIKNWIGYVPKTGI